MKTQFGQGMRVASAIALKDIADSLKNKTLLSTMMTVLFLLTFYRVLPILGQRDDPLQVALYDEGNPRLVMALDKAEDIDLRMAESREEMERRIGRDNSLVLGLVLPAGLETAADPTVPIVLSGYVDHWVKENPAAEARSLVEDRLAGTLGQPVRIELETDTVFSRADGGNAFSTSLGMTITLAIVGLMIIPSLILEEKQSRTMDALLVSPATMGHLVLGKALAGLFYCLAGALVVTAFGIGFIVRWDVWIVATMCGSIFAVAAGLLLGSLVEIRQQLSLWSFVLIQPIIVSVVATYLGSALPEWVGKVSYWLPMGALYTTWSAALTGGASLATVAAELALAIAYAAVLMVGVTLVLRRSADRPGA